MVVIFLFILVCLIVFIYFYNSTTGSPHTARNLNVPYSLKLYLAQNASTKLKVKFLQTSKAMQKILPSYNVNQVDFLEIIERSKHEQFLFWKWDNFIGMSINPNEFNQLNCISLKVKTHLKFTSCFESYQIREICQKLDLSQIKEIIIYYQNLDSQTLRALLKPSLKKIIIFSCKVYGIDTPLEIMQKCPFVTELSVPWQKGVTTLASLSSLQRNIKLKDCGMEGLPFFPTASEVLIFAKAHLKQQSLMTLTVSHEAEYNCDLDLRTNEIIQREFPYVFVGLD